MRTLFTLTLVSWAAVAAAAPQKLSLKDAVGLALREDPLVGEAKVQHDRSRLGVLRAQLDRFSLKGDASVQELWNRNNIGLPDSAQCIGPLKTAAASNAQACAAANGFWNDNAAWTGYSNLSVRLSYFLFSGFRVEANVTRAKTTESAAVVQIRQQQKDTAISIARSYWAARRLMMRIEVQEAALRRLGDAEAVAAARLKAGFAPAIDRNRAASRRLQQAAAVEDLRGQTQVLLAQLGVALGLHGELELTDEAYVPDAPPPSLDALLPHAFHSRPDLLNAKLQVDIQHQQVRIARSGFYPQVTLLGAFQYGNNPYDVASGVYKPAAAAANPFDSLSGSFTAGAVLTLNVFDTLNTYTSTGDARYEERRLQQEVRRYARLVDADVRSAYASLRKLYAQRLPLMAARDMARDNLKIIEARYRNGDALIIDYLDAQIDLSNVESQLAELTGQLQLQWLELDAALGNTVGVDHG